MATTGWTARRQNVGDGADGEEAGRRRRGGWRGGGTETGQAVKRRKGDDSGRGKKGGLGERPDG
ncbi:unnamed protein product [Spirodela intermedia]|uniref:Uncharacterized protein n=1 Tax=Spirodela intermedia TaxID=51605 RepID=A0ABN7E9I6_SPIIN|nr:unnamed protein product [Spirodela intermedia]